MAKKKSQRNTEVPPENKTMSTHMVRSLYPPFYELDEYTFQNLSREIFAQEDGIIAARLYGTRGQKQHGIDILAESRSDEIEVGQCKRYQTFSLKNIIDASNEFFEHWDTHWKLRKVRRFLLFVACQITDPKSIDEIGKQKLRFNQYGIQYEVWDAGKLEQKLRPHSQIVAKFCEPAEYWIERICYIVYSSAASKTPDQNQAEISINITITNQLSGLASHIAEKELQEIRTLWHQGNEKDALIRLEKVKSDTEIWANASAELKARIICIDASIALETGKDIVIVRNLLDEAHSYAQVVNEKRVRALLLVRDGNLTDALNLLANEDDVDTVNLQVALLFDAGQHTTAIELLSELMTKGNTSAETYRLMALAKLAQGNLDQAEEYIRQAKEKEPTWFQVQFIEGIIAYYGSLSPAAVPTSLVVFPSPVDWMMITQDVKGITSLRKAEKIFAQLSENTQRVEYYITAWRLACLLNDAERQEEALTYCASILEGNPIYFPAIVWATARRLDVDFEPSIKLLEQKITDPDVELKTILSLVSLYDYGERFADGLHLLESTHDRFEQQPEIWTVNYIRLLMGINDEDEIDKLAANLPEGEEYLVAQSLIAAHRATQSGQWSEFVTDQMELFQKTQRPELLLDVCMALYRDRKWEEFTQYADPLIEQIGTAGILRRVILGVFHARQYERCLTFIERWKQKFSIEKIQQEFRPIEILCFRALGNYEKALIEARSLVTNNPSITNTLTLIDLLYELGNDDDIVVYANSLRDLDLHPEMLLHLAQILRGSHSSLAQFFWRKAVENDLPDEYTSTAFGLAFNLGLEDEKGDLFSRLVSYDTAEKQPIQGIQTKQELLQVYENLWQKNIEFKNAYRSGVLPIHFYAEELNHPFFELFHDDLEGQEGSINFNPLYIRYGGRPLLEGFPEPIKNLRLFVDVSALLLSHHLGILDVVEQAFAPLYIPSEIFASLTAMVDRTYHHQPSVIEANKAIIRLVNRKKLKVAPLQQHEEIDPELDQLGSEWKECFLLAKARKGYFLSFLPPTKMGEVNLSEPIILTPIYLKYLINCRILIDTLLDKAELTQEQYTNAVEKLGRLAEIYPNAYPQPLHRHDFIICDDDVINSLARTGILEYACNVFDVYITQRSFEIAQGATRWDIDREETRKWLQALQKRLRMGLQQQYITLPIRNYDNAERANTTSSVLFALIQHAETLQESDAIWIDDRYSNHYNWVGKSPLIGIVDILKLLVGKQVISLEAYYDRLIQLRAGNVRFIPLKPEELLYHLMRALKEENGNYWIEETRSLVIIKRSIAACIVDRKDFQLPPVPEQITHKQGEVEFLLNLHHVIQQTLHHIWLSVPQLEAREILADWIITHLYLDYPSLIFREKDQRPADQPDYYRAGAQLTVFLSLAHLQLLNEVKVANVYKHYIEWVISRIIGRRLHTEPELLEAAANVIKQTVVHLKNENMNEFSDEAISVFFQHYLNSMPEILQEKIETDENFLQQISAEITPVITVGDLQFEQGKFWQAVEIVVNGGKKAIREANMDVMVRFYSLEAQENLVVYLDHPQRDERIDLKHTEFSILRYSNEEQERFLRNQRHTFDYSDIEFQELVKELQSIRDPMQRVLRLLALWAESAAVTYQTFARSLQRKQLNIFKLATISFQSLQRYLRLVEDNNIDTSYRIEQGVVKLIQELGIEVAFFRFSGLPSPLPQPIIDVLDAMPRSKRKKLLKNWIRSARSIPATIHLIRLLYRYQTDASLLREATRLANEISDEAVQAEIEAFLALLIWIHQQFFLRTEFLNVSTQLKIIITWTHAHTLFSIMKANNIDFAWMKAMFKNDASRMSVEVLLLDKTYRGDIAHPRFISYERLLLTGLLYALDGKISNLLPKLRDRLTDLAFPFVQPEHRIPALFLTLNTAFLSNMSNAFLSRNIGEELAPLIEGTQPEEFTNEALTLLIGQLIENILSDQVDNEEEKSWSWALLYSAIQDIPLPAELVKRLTDLFLTLDWVNLFNGQYTIWRVAFKLAALQYHSLKNDTLKQRLQTGLDEIASICNNIETHSGPIGDKKRYEIIDTLLESAIRLAVDPQTGKVVLETFSNTIIDMAWRWKYLGTESKKVIQAMCEELPLPYAQQLWSTLVTLRAM